MSTQIDNFLRKSNVVVTEVMYMTHDERKTCLHLTDGRKVETFHPLKRVIEAFPVGSFEVINKGIAIAPCFVERAQYNVFRMKDGVEFHGRARKKKDELCSQVLMNGKRGLEWAQFSILDNLPIAFCIIELVVDENKHGIDFIFRYCNKEMEVLEGKPISEMINKSFYEIFKDGDQKWLVIYADVAVNGVTKVIEDYSPEIGAKLKIYCYQPKPNFCACALTVI